MNSEAKPINREVPTQLAQAGFERLALAFNILEFEQYPWTVSPEVKREFHVLARQVIRLFEDSELIENPAHARYLKAQAARQDPALQKLIRRASKKTPIRAL